MGLFMLILALLGAAIHIIFLKNKSAGKIAEVILLYLLFVAVGLGTFLAGLMHVFNGPATAKLIGWEPGSPFQAEVGYADIAFGLLGIFCLFIRGNFWLATIVANSAFLFLCMAGHIYSLAKNGNNAVYNIGPNTVIADVIIPIVLILLYVLISFMEKKKAIID